MDAEIGRRTSVELEPKPGHFEFHTGDRWMAAHIPTLIQALRSQYIHPERELERLHAGAWVTVRGIVYRFVAEATE